MIFYIVCEATTTIFLAFYLYLYLTFIITIFIYLFINKMTILFTITDCPLLDSSLKFRSRVEYNCRKSYKIILVNVNILGTIFVYLKPWCLNLQGTILTTRLFQRP